MPLGSCLVNKLIFFAKYEFHPMLAPGSPPPALWRDRNADPDRIRTLGETPPPNTCNGGTWFKTGTRLEYVFESSPLPCYRESEGDHKTHPGAGQKNRPLWGRRDGHQSLASRGRSVSAGSRGGTGFPPLPWPRSHAAVPHLTARGRTSSHRSAPLQVPLAGSLFLFFLHFT